MGGAHSELADPAEVSIHRGDLLMATGHTSDAGRFYNADSGAARAARAIMNGTSRPANEGFVSLSRAAKDLPDSGLVQYHFGALTAADKKEIPAQGDALQRATQLLPLFGPAFAELARVDTLLGKADRALPLLDHALELSPEFADHFYEIRADAFVALNKYDDAFRALNLAETLPHADRKVATSYATKISALKKKVESIRSAADSRSMERLRAEVDAKVEAVTPPPKPEPPPVPVPAGRVTYEIEARTTLEVVKAVYPEYPDELRKKGTTGRIILRVDIGADGAVKTAAITDSQLPALNAGALEAAKQWTFRLPQASRPATASIKLVFSYLLP